VIIHVKRERTQLRIEGVAGRSILHPGHITTEIAKSPGISDEVISVGHKIAITVGNHNLIHCRFQVMVFGDDGIFGLDFTVSRGIKPAPHGQGAVRQVSIGGVIRNGDVCQARDGVVCGVQAASVLIR